MKKLISSLVLGACTSLVAAPAVMAQDTAELESVTYLLPAPQNLPAFAPWLIAKQAGYFADRGLDVDFVSGKGGVDVAKQVGAGNAPIGGAMGDTSIIVRANDIPVKSVAVLGDGGMLLIASPADAPINEPAELEGKTITTIAYTDTGYYGLLGTLQKAGLTRDDAEIQAAGPAGVWQLVANGKADAMAGVADWVVNIEDTGMELNLMDPSKAFETMSQAIVVADDTIKNNPKFVQDMVDATLLGMKLIMEDPDEAVRVYVEAVPAHKGNEDYIRRVFDLYNKYVYADQKVLGKIDSDRLSRVQDFYVSQGIVRNESPLDELYTNQFIKE
ncbi:MAG TPA: ABC transporter substrate-binding protein [Burkholderiaceae bacterium]|nr:ABC transporter substrate-binding protein [Burkholderiaceae bacterium]